MKPLRSILFVGVFICWAGIAQAMTLGASGGVTVLIPPRGGDSVTNIGVPGTSGIFAVGFQPGLRLGTSSETGSDLLVDLGLSSLIASGTSFTSFQGTLNLQHHFRTGSGAGPFVTVGAGALVLSGESDTSSNAVFGGGLGIRSIVSDGHGALRGEVRVDYITEDNTGFVGGVSVGFKLGFDLLMR